VLIKSCPATFLNITRGVSMFAAKGCATEKNALCLYNPAIDCRQFETRVVELESKQFRVAGAGPHFFKNGRAGV